MEETVLIEVSVNGHSRRDHVPARLLLADYIREWCGMLGTHVACAQGVCGSCTILVNDLPIRSCLVLAAQVNGDAIRTVESLATDGALSTLQTSFRANHALQCGFCTSGILMTAQALLERTDELETEQIEEAISGHVCRCTGYEPILAAVRDAAQAWNRDPAL